MSHFYRIRLHGEFVIFGDEETFGFFTTIHLPDMTASEAKRRVQQILLSRMKDENIRIIESGVFRSVFRIDAFMHGPLKEGEDIPSDGGFNFYPMSATSIKPAILAWWRRRNRDKYLLDDVLQ